MNTEMKTQPPGPSKKKLYAAIGGTLLVALCCFTPILVIALGAFGLSTVTPYLDYVLLPALLVMIMVVIISYLKWKKANIKI
jgi:mercuric ion transport protein